jgi:flagellin
VPGAPADLKDGSTGNNVAFFQVGANANQGITFDFETVSRAVTGAASVATLVATLISNPSQGSGIGRGISVTPLISELQSSLDDIGSIRANLGALQNRMDFTMRSLDISSENLQDSESRVRNADVAREMMRFTMANVLQQAAVSMLAQANQLPNNLLQLLR